jgi:hypothetical protein
MAITSRALAFASRWFDEATVRRVFEPLIADWQRQWLEAPRSRRALIALYGFSAFACAVIVSSPRIARTPSPAGLTDQIARRVTRFTALATALLMIPVFIELTTWWLKDASWIRASLYLLAVPSAITMVFPFAMTGAVDAIRHHQPMPPHVERAVLLKLGAFFVLFMLIYSGWVVPAAGQAARNAMNPERMSAPLLRVEDLTTLALLFDPDRATVFAQGTYSASRAFSVQHELNKRIVLMALPLVLLWLRWRVFNLPRRRWLRPLPWMAAAPVAFAAFIALFFLGFLLEKQLRLPPGIGNWLPIAAFALWATVTKYCRPLLLALVNG